MEMYRGKIFNEEVFEKYLKTLPSTKKNALISSGIYTNVNKYKAKLSDQVGGFAIVEPIKGRIGGTPVNYDGNTNIPKGAERDTFYQRKVCFGRANSWGEYDFSADITNTNFKAEAGEVKEYWNEERQTTLLSILKGIFSMTGGVNGQFVDKHTYSVKGNLGADALNRATQKALGDAKSELTTMITHSMVSTNLEGLNLIDFLKYTDAQGIEQDLTIGTFNGKLVIVDDGMPSEDKYEKTTDVSVDSSKTYYTRSGSESAGYTYTEVENPTDAQIANYYEKYTEYVTYVFKKGFFEYEDIGLVTNKAIELARDPYDKGGKTDLISRIREAIIPTYISYVGVDTISPENSDFENGSNWELANNNKVGDNKVYVDDKLIPLARVISRG